MNKIAKVTAALAAAGVLGAGAGCTNSLNGGGSFKDVENVKPVDADSYTLLNNVDGYPNIVIVCYGGVSFVTTTRTNNGVLTRVPELDKKCPGYVAPTGPQGMRMYVGGTAKSNAGATEGS
jgi:hypothetical protein